ncbi:hypothetical protein M8994_10775 [Brucella sp. 21LCYQ03]|nr:hypothetical protein [Brucella sp. 21LCYQ03]
MRFIAAEAASRILSSMIATGPTPVTDQVDSVLLKSAFREKARRLFFWNLSAMAVVYHINIDQLFHSDLREKIKRQISHHINIDLHLYLIGPSLTAPSTTSKET